MPPVDTIYRVAIERHWLQVPALQQVNVLWFRQHEGTSLDAHDLAQDVRTTSALDSPLRVFHHQWWIFDRVTAQQMLPVKLDPVESRYAANTGGNDVTHPVAPPLLTCVLTLRTATQGRSHRGRTFFSPATMRWEITQTFWDVNVQNEINAWAAAMHVRYVPGGPVPWTWGLWSSKLGGKPPATVAGFQAFNQPPTVTSRLIRALHRREK